MNYKKELEKAQNALKRAQNLYSKWSKKPQKPETWAQANKRALSAQYECDRVNYLEAWINFLEAKLRGEEASDLYEQAQILKKECEQNKHQELKRAAKKGHNEEAPATETASKTGQEIGGGELEAQVAKEILSWHNQNFTWSDIGRNWAHLLESESSPRKRGMQLVISAKNSLKNET